MQQQSSDQDSKALSLEVDQLGVAAYDNMNLKLNEQACLGDITHDDEYGPPCRGRGRKISKMRMTVVVVMRMRRMRMIVIR